MNGLFDRLWFFAMVAMNDSGVDIRYSGPQPVQAQAQGRWN